MIFQDVHQPALHQASVLVNGSYYLWKCPWLRTRLLLII
jgi:hypothetical protein